MIKKKPIINMVLLFLHIFLFGGSTLKKTFTFSKKSTIKRVPTLDTHSFSTFSVDIVRFPISSKHVGSFNLFFKTLPTDFFFCITKHSGNSLSISFDLHAFKASNHANFFIDKLKVEKALRERTYSPAPNTLSTVPFLFTDQIILFSNPNRHSLPINPYLPTIRLSDFHKKIQPSLKEFLKSQNKVILHDRSNSKKFNLTVLDHDFHADKEIYLFTENEDIFNVLNTLDNFLHT